jgi:hypothetical protein
MPGSAPIQKRKTRRARRRATFDTTLGRAMLQAAAVIAFFALWETGVRAGWISAFLVGSPFGIFSLGFKMIASGELLSDTWYTLFEAILGFVIGTIFGSLLGLALWYSVFVARLVEPFIVAINSVPKIALAPIVVLWFGTGLVSKVALSVSLTAIVALIAAYQAAKDADGRGQAPGVLQGGGAVDPAVDHRYVPDQYRLRAGRGGGGRIHFIAARAWPPDLHRLQPVRSQHGLGRAVHADDHGVRTLLRDRHHRADEFALEAVEHHASGSGLRF